LVTLYSVNLKLQTIMQETTQTQLSNEMQVSNQVENVGAGNGTKNSYNEVIKEILNSYGTPDWKFEC